MRAWRIALGAAEEANDGVERVGQGLPSMGLAQLPVAAHTDRSPCLMLFISSYYQFYYGSGFGRPKEFMGNWPAPFSDLILFYCCVRATAPSSLPL